MAINDLQTLLLREISLNPVTGYDMMKVIKESAAWEINHQQIYRELKILLDRGLLDVKEINQQGKPNKRVYSITEQGADALLDIQLNRSFKPRTLRHLSTTMLQIGSTSYFEEMVNNLTKQVQTLTEKMENETDCKVTSLIMARDMAMLHSDLTFAHSALEILTNE